MKRFLDILGMLVFGVMGGGAALLLGYIVIWIFPGVVDLILDAFMGVLGFYAGAICAVFSVVILVASLGFYFGVRSWERRR